MDLVAQYAALARYNRWMNERLYTLCAAVPEEERRRDLGAFFHSIHGTLNHLLLTDRAWLARFTGDRLLATTVDAAGNRVPFRGLDQELFSDFQTLQDERGTTDLALEAWVHTLTVAQLESTLVYRTSAGEKQEHSLWWAVTHLFNHQTHHRGQVTTLLKQLGHDPGITDLIVMLRSSQVQ